MGLYSLDSHSQAVIAIDQRGGKRLEINTQRSKSFIVTNRLILVKYINSLELHCSSLKGYHGFFLVKTLKWAQE